MIPPLTILLPVLALGGIVSTIAGGGLGILLTIASTFFVDVRTSVVLVSFLGLAVQLAKIAHFARDARWNIVGWYVMLGIPMSFVGAPLLFFISPRMIEIVVGLFCAAFAIADLLALRPAVQPTRGSLLVLGGVNGFVGGLVGQGAIIRSSALLSFGLTKEQYIGTSCVIALALNLGKSSVYAAQMPWTEEIVRLMLIAVPLLLSSVWIGKKLLRFVEPAMFEKLVLALVLLGSIKLLFFPA